MLSPDKSDDTFEHLFAAYGVSDYCIWHNLGGLVRCRAYSDGGWLMGVKSDFIIYWGA